jgi:putative PIN family toxin of toxin-antitoxin system
MLRPSVVLDTNVIISAHLRADGLERFALDLAIKHRVQLCYSEPILAEYEAVLKRAKFRISPAKLAESLLLIRTTGKRVFPKLQLHAAIDPDDNIFLECAEEARAQYLVTGNKRHFPETWRNTRIVNARELLTEILGDLKR